ncbi:MAG: hypothetical protein ACLUR5_08465 [Eubacterium ventriosum]
MKNKSKTGGKNLNRGRRKWFHKGEFIGLDIQSVLMTVLTMLTIVVTVVMGLLIYNRFKMSVKETNISSTEGISRQRSRKNEFRFVQYKTDFKCAEL